MKAIKGLVIFMGVLLLAGLGLLGYGLMTKTHHKGMAAPGANATDFGQVSVPVPAGARIEQMTAASDRVILRLSGTGPERIMVLDPASGRVTGSFALTPEPQVR
jgi:hypothetical protein